MTPEQTIQRPSTVFGIWIAAIRPATLWAGAVPVIAAAALSYSDANAISVLSWLALLCSLLLQVGCNLVNDYADFATGADGPDRLGPARAAAQGWLTPNSIKRGAVVSLAAAALCGLYLIYVGGWPILVVGVASIVCAVAYTAGPFPLAYLGLGDVFVLFFFGVVATAGTYFLETNTVTPSAMLIGTAIGCLATAILVVNNLRDQEGDARVGKKTLAVRFGERFARIEYSVLTVLPYLLVALAVWRFGLKPSSLLVCATLPLAWRQNRAIWTKAKADLNPHLAGTAKLELLFGVSFAVGLVVP